MKIKELKNKIVDKFKKINIPILNKSDLIMSFIMSLFCSITTKFYYNDVSLGIFGLICFFIGMLYKDGQHLEEKKGEK